MKQFLLTVVLFVFGFAALAGINANKQSIKNKKFRTANITKAIGSDDVNTSSKTAATVYKAKKLSAPVGDVVGTTTYDLQTNSGVCRRVATNANGAFTYVGWTMGMDFSADAPGRGTGFNVYTRNSGTWGDAPTSRIEPMTRVGWPTIGFSQGRQFSITHTGSLGMMFAYRTGAGSDWTENIVGSSVGDSGGVWARAAADSPNIYCIIGRPFDSEPFNGINGGLHVIKSADNGDTWESMGGLEADYSNSYARNMTADTYQIDASNGVVSVVFGTAMTPIVLYKSLDEAKSWSKTIIQPMASNPLAKDINNDPADPDFTVDPYFASDGGNSVIIDSEGISHVVFSANIVFNIPDNDYITSGQYYLLRETASLFYWNDGMTESEEKPKMIGKSVMNNADGDEFLGSRINAWVEGNMPYYSNMVAHPQLGIDADDNLYLSYSALVDGDFVPPTVTFESSEDGGETVADFEATFPEESNVYSDVFMLKSTDKGGTWEGPLNITNAPDSEEAYPSIARFIHDTIMVAYQHDLLPGTLLQAPQALATINEIAVAKVLPSDINNDAAPPDSEPYLSVVSTGYILPVMCSLDKDTYLKANSWGFDYPDGLISDVQIEGLADYSTPGMYTEALFVEDSEGNRSDTIQVSVEVVPDEHAPEISIDGPCDEFSVLVDSEWTNPPVNIIDLVEYEGEIGDSGCDVTENLQIEDNVDTSTVGTYEVTYTVADFSGNENVLELTVNVVAEDTEGPDITVENLPELLGLFDPFNPDDVNIIATDKIDCEVTDVVVEGLDAVNTEELGEYDITITATDSSENSTSETYTIIVGDNTPPTIILNGTYTIEVGPGDCGADGIFNRDDDPWLYASDDTDGDLTSKVVADYNYGSDIDCSVDGTYTITYTVSDEGGNEAVAERSIKVVSTGIEENPIYDFVDIFPNPTKGQLYVETTNLKVKEITVYNAIGKTIISLNEGEVKQNSKLDLTDQADGIYMVNVVTDLGTITRKVNVARD